MWPPYGYSSEVLRLPKLKFHAAKWRDSPNPAVAVAAAGGGAQIFHKTFVTVMGKIKPKPKIIGIETATELSPSAYFSRHASLASAMAAPRHRAGDATRAGTLHRDESSCKRR